jgi:hypothetical protein
MGGPDGIVVWIYNKQPCKCIDERIDERIDRRIDVYFLVRLR